MKRNYNDITIREATVGDAEQLCQWWNDGNVMAHAGFPNGLGTTPEIVANQIANQSKQSACRHMILYKGNLIGEMNYIDKENKTCEIGIKICDADKQNKGIGKIVLSLFIDGLFEELNYEKIVLDTNMNNERAQHVYEQLGFQKVRVNVDSWKDQLGNMQSSVEYELIKDDFVSWL